MLSIEANETKKGMGIHARRILAYVVLILVSFLCLFWFYVLFVSPLYRFEHKYRRERQ